MTTATLPDPPVPMDCDLRRYRKMPIDVVRLKSSDIQMECTPEERWFAFELWMASFHQVPASSLPDDDVKLAYLAGLGRDKRTWNRVKKVALRGFVKHSDGRLYHPVMSELSLEVWESMRSRKRGAVQTNSKRYNRQAVENTKDQSHSAPRSIYKERDGQRTPSDHSAPRSAVATEGVGITPPLPPSFGAVAGSGSLEAPPDRPATIGPSAEPEFVEVTIDTGAKLRITRNGQVDEIWTPLDCPQTMLTRKQALALRAQALGRETAEPMGAA